jgi:hypothetical protein
MYSAWIEDLLSIPQILVQYLPLLYDVTYQQVCGQWSRRFSSRVDMWVLPAIAGPRPLPWAVGASHTCVYLHPRARVPHPG